MKPSWQIVTRNRGCQPQRFWGAKHHFILLKKISDNFFSNLEIQASPGPEYKGIDWLVFQKVHVSYRITKPLMKIWSLTRWGTPTRIWRPSPLPLRVAKAVRHHMNEEITPVLPIGKGAQYSQTISNLGHDDMIIWTPPINESAELIRGPSS